MSHKVTIGNVNFEQVEVDLDYSELQENLDLSDYVEVDDLQYQIEYHLPDMEEECTTQAGVLLRSFIDVESPCYLGDLFIEAVQKAMMWDGDRFEALPSSASAARTNLKHEMRAVLADILLGTPNVNGETTHEIGND